MDSVDDPTNGDAAGDSSLFADRQGFFRASPDEADQDGFSAFVIEAGPTWTPEEANDSTHAFFTALAGSREVVPHSNAFDFVIANELLLLLSDDHQVAFEQHYRRMDDATIRQWQELLDGGTASEAFGPLSLQEQLDETQLADQLKSQRNSRMIGLVAGVAVVVLAAVGIAFLLAPDDEPETSAQFSFEDPTEAGSGGAVGTPRPNISAAVVAPVLNPVVVRSGVGPASDRVEPTPDESLFDEAFDDVHFVLLAEGGEGRVALVGTPGWYDDLCVIVSAVSDRLRPLATAHYAPNSEACGIVPNGEAAEAVCSAADVLMLPLDVPEGVVELDEGGEATVDSIRARVLRTSDEYEQISRRGAIDLSVDGSAVIPAFAFSSTDTVELDIPVTATENVVTTCSAPAG